MARVIKGGIGAGAARPATRVLAHADVKKVIEKETFLAKQEAGELLKRAEDERREILAEGKLRAARAREEAMSRGASEAFAAAAAEALLAFRRRADRYDEAADDIRILAVEITRKLLGTDPDLGPQDIDRILASGLSKLRAKRKLRVLVAVGRRTALQYERPNLIKAVDNEPDLLLEEAADVGIGFARVVTEVGGALCAEDNALEALAQAVNVKEIARTGVAARAGKTGPLNTATHVGQRPQAPMATGEDDIEDIDDIDDIDGEDDSVEDLPEASWSADEDGDGDEDLPDAAIDDDDDDLDLAPLPAALPRPRVSAQPLHASLPAMPTSTRPAAVRSSPMPASTADRVPLGRVQAGNRAATRVLAVDDRDALRAATKRGPERVDLGTDDDDELDLFTDERPIRPR